MKGFLKKAVAVVVMGVALTGCGGAPKSDSPFQEGVHYTQLSGFEVSTTPQIVKFVSFTCPACRAFDEAVGDYTPPNGVRYERFPVLLGNASWFSLVKAYGVLRMLGVHEQLSGELFKAVQEDRIYLGDQESLALWLQLKANVSPERVKQIYQSPELAQTLDMYNAAERRYDIRFIPQVIVNGAYRVNLKAIAHADEAVQRQNLHDLMNYLVTQ